MADASAPKTRRRNVKLSAGVKARIIELHETRGDDGKPMPYRDIERTMAAEGMSVSKKGIGDVLRALGQSVVQEAKQNLVDRVAKTVDANVARMERMANLLAEIAEDVGVADRDRVAAARGAADVSFRVVGLGLNEPETDVDSLERDLATVYGFARHRGAANGETADDGHARH